MRVPSWAGVRVGRVGAGVGAGVGVGVLVTISCVLVVGWKQLMYTFFSQLLVVKYECPASFSRRSLSILVDTQPLNTKHHVDV